MPSIKLKAESADGVDALRLRLSPLSFVFFNV